MAKTDQQEDLVISYLSIRKAIGILGIALPVVLVLGSAMGGHCLEVKDSISHYYYTAMGDVLVGLLCATAIFLITYKGHEGDKLFTNLAGVFALGIAFMPTSNIRDCSCELFRLPENPIRETAHLASAALFFITLAYISYFRFVRTRDVSRNPLPGYRITAEKKMRNRIYRVCGIVMVSGVALIGLYWWVLPETLRLRMRDFRPVFWLESLSLWAFGVSWLVKGEAILKDR